MDFRNYFTGVFIVYKCDNKTFCSKNWALIYICFIWFGVAFDVTVLKVLNFCWFLSKIIGNHRFFHCRRFNLFEIAINNSLRNVDQYLFPTLCNALHSKKSNYLIYGIIIIGDVSSYMRLCWQIIKKNERDRNCEQARKT